MSKQTRFILVGVLVLLAGTVALIRSAASPALLEPDAPGAFGFSVGERVADAPVAAAGVEADRLSDLVAGEDALVIAVHSDCPASRRAEAALSQLRETVESSGVAFLRVDASGAEDGNARLLGALQPRSGGEVFLLDGTRTLRYRGGVAGTEDGLSSALQAVVAGERVEASAPAPSECPLEEVAGGVPERPITYHNRVSRIVQRHCLDCHRDGSLAPFPLETYDQVRGQAPAIANAVSEGRMPPWFADPDHGRWENDRSLSERDRRDLLAWIEAGGPEGDPRAAPLPREHVPGWHLDQEPDTVLRLPEPQQVPAEGVLEYRYVYLKTDYPEDRWIQKAELRPTAPEVAHHAIVFQEAPEDEDRGPWVVGYAPGVPPSLFPEGTGKLLPAGGWLMFQLHYTTNGSPATDRTELALVFADEVPESRVQTRDVGTRDFEIPAGDPNYQVVAEHEFERPGRILSFLPHMHYRGKAFRYELVLPDGTEEVLLDVPNYDFNWQLQYVAEEPIRVEPGMVLRGRAWYDNSAENPANPDPTVDVGFGEQSFEEMMFGFYEWVEAPAPPTEGPATSSADSPR